MDTFSAVGGNKKYHYTLTTTSTVLIILVLCLFIAPETSIAFRLRADVFDAQTIVKILAPAFLCSLLIERAVEIFVVSLRKSRRELLECELSKISQSFKYLNSEKELFQGQQGEADELEEKLAAQSEKQLDLQTSIASYKRNTTVLSSTFSLIFSFLIALIGVRLLSPFFTIEYADCLSGLNIIPEDCPSGIDNLKDFHRWFTRFDVFISTFVIAGGAEGMHSIVGAITSFADKTKITNGTDL